MTSKVEVKGEYVTLVVVHQPYVTKTVYKYIDTDEGKKKIKEEREVRGKTFYPRHTCRIDSISSVDDYITSKSCISKNRCVIFDRFSGRDFIVNHSRSQIEELLVNKSHKKIGY